MKVYLDNAATTPIDPRVLESMIPYFKEFFGNPSSTHFYGRQTKAAIETTRRNVAKLLNCTPGEIIFTSGGTEADNLAIFNAVENLGVTHVITSPIEHHAVLHSVEKVECSKVRISLVNVDNKGNVDLDHLSELIKDDEKTLVSLMHANNEIGTITPIKKVSAICKSKNALFHSDTVQTMGHYAFDVQELDIDFLTCSAHKLHGPKGVGFLYANKQHKISPILHGGGQERNHRGGTENIYGIVGLGKALELAFEDLDGHRKHVLSLKSHMIAELTKSIPGVSFYGEIDPEKSLYTVLNVCFPKNPKGNLLLFTLDLKGVAVSGGSACSSGAQIGSHVLKSINADHKRSNARFSFSRMNTIEEIEYALDQVKCIFKNVLIEK
jgi:cysteine desulfurase